MSKLEFETLINLMEDTYGVPSYNVNEDDVEEGNMWFICPECGEVIAYDDWADEDIVDFIEGMFICPVCGEEMEIG